MSGQKIKQTKLSVEQLAKVVGGWGGLQNTVTGGTGNDVLTGGSGADHMLGGAGNDQISGGDGNDWESGGAGNDLMFGGAGNDIMNGEPGNDSLHGGAGDDRMTGGDGNDRLLGDSGNDTVYGGDGRDWIEGGENNDTLYGNEGEDVLEGDQGNDTLAGGDDNDKLYGGTGNDQLDGGVGNDIAFGGDGNDKIWGGYGDDILTGGEGTNTLVGGDGADTFHFNAEEVSIDRIRDFDPNTDKIEILGYADWDSFISSVKVQYLDNGMGVIKFPNDKIIQIDNAGLHGISYNWFRFYGGENQQDAVVDDAGRDEYALGFGTDTFTWSPDGSRDTVDGGSGQDTLILDGAVIDNIKSASFILPTREQVIAGASFEIPKGEQTIMLKDGSVLVLNHMEKLTFSSNAPGVLTGSGGADTITGGDEANRIYAGDGDDVINGGAGDDKMTGGNGRDVFVYDSLSASHDTITDFNPAQDTIRIPLVSDWESLRSMMTASGNDTIIKLGSGSITLTGVSLASLGPQNFDLWLDQIKGGDSNDTLKGDADADSLDGGAGVDRLDGGRGDDMLVGGAGGDLFVFDPRQGGVDSILDFSPAQGDRIEIPGANWEMVKRCMKEANGGTVIDFGNGNQLIIENVLPGQLTASMFSFNRVNDIGVGR